VGSQYSLAGARNDAVELEQALEATARGLKLAKTSEQKRTDMLPVVGRIFPGCGRSCMSRSVLGLRVGKARVRCARRSRTVISTFWGYGVRGDAVGRYIHGKEAPRSLTSLSVLMLCFSVAAHPTALVSPHPARLVATAAHTGMGRSHREA
jgi:hypothetical protein